MSIAALIRDMAQAGATPEAIAIAVEAIEALQQKETDRKAKRAEQKRKEREKVATVARQSSDKVSPFIPPDKEVPTPLEITPPYIPPSKHVSDSARETEFSQFWEIYPHKVGKRDAEKAFSQARKRDSAENIQAGLRRYAAKTDDRPWCNPSTFLNQDRWLDAPSNSPPLRHATAPPNGLAEMNRLLNEIQGKSSEQPPTYEASYERTDSGSSTGIIQFDAFAARR